MISNALNQLGRKIEELICSSLYITLPRYNINQPPYYNAVCRGNTYLSPEELLYELNRIENNLGRNRDLEEFKGQRSMDLDLLLYDSRVMTTENLTIPHPGIRERKFVLVPLLELNPELVDPRDRTQFSKCLKMLDSQGIYYENLKAYDGIYTFGGNLI